MEVKFINEEDGVQLGCRTYDGIAQTIIPAFNTNDHDIYFTKSFSKNRDYRSWLVKSVVITDEGAEIYVSGNPIPDSVYAYAKKQRRNFNSYIRKHSIVEVDFGHETLTFGLTSGKEKNTYRTDSLMPGEMHKKRPCIVMGTRMNSVTVIPLSTKDYGNPKHVPISSESFSNLHPRYSEKISFAALDVIQTVSAHRVFPPREAQGGRYRHQYSRYKLTKADGDAVDNTLADIYNDDITKQLKITQTSLASVRMEKSKLFDKYNEVATQLEDAESEIKELKDIISNVAKSFDINGDFEEVLKELKAL